MSSAQLQHSLRHTEEIKLEFFFNCLRQRQQHYSGNSSISSVIKGRQAGHHYFYNKYGFSPPPSFPLSSNKTLLLRTEGAGLTLKITFCHSATAAPDLTFYNNGASKCFWTTFNSQVSWCWGFNIANESVGLYGGSIIGAGKRKEEKEKPKVAKYFLLLPVIFPLLLIFFSIPTWLLSHYFPFLTSSILSFSSSPPFGPGPSVYSAS